MATDVGHCHCKSSRSLYPHRSMLMNAHVAHVLGKKNTVVSVQHHVTMYQKLQLTSAGLVQDKNEQERHSRQEEGNGHHQQCIPRQRCKHLAVGTKMNMYRPCMLSDNKKYINYAYTIIYVYMYGDMYTSSNCFINLHK